MHSQCTVLTNNNRNAPEGQRDISESLETMKSNRGMCNKKLGIDYREVMLFKVKSAPEPWQCLTSGSHAPCLHIWGDSQIQSSCAAPAWSCLRVPPCHLALPQRRRQLPSALHIHSTDIPHVYRTLVIVEALFITSCTCATVQRTTYTLAVRQLRCCSSPAF